MRLVRNLITHRELLLMLMLREISARYRQSLLGWAWALLQAPAVTFMALLVRYFLAGGEMDGQVIVQTYAAVLPWTFFSSAIMYSTPSVVRNSAMLKKIYFPRDIFVLSAVFTSLFDFIAGSLPLIGLMIYYRIPPTIYLAYLPLLLLIEVVFACGIGLLTATMAVFKRDIIYGVPFLMMFWMILSPVFYTLQDVVQNVSAHVMRLYMLNPMAGLIESYRRILTGEGVPNFHHVAYAAAVTLVVLLVCQRIFTRLEMTFADVV